MGVGVCWVGVADEVKPAPACVHVHASAVHYCQGSIIAGQRVMMKAAVVNVTVNE